MGLRWGLALAWTPTGLFRVANTNMLVLTKRQTQREPPWTQHEPQRK